MAVVSTLSGCALENGGGEEVESGVAALVTSCSADSQCGSGYICASTGACVRPANCYSGATGAGVLTGSLVIDATDTQADLQALNGAWCVTGDVSVKKTALADLTGLNGLNAVAGSISIEDNSALASLQGLDGLRRAGKLALFRNASLSSLSALSQLRTLMSLQAYINPKLNDLDGLQGVTTISNAEVVNNAGLTSLRGLEGITQVYSYIDVRLNPKLTDMNGLNAIASIGNLLQITDNSGLSSLQGLGRLVSIGSTLRIWRNPQLSSIAALAKLTRAPTFQVADNPALDSCSVTDLATRLATDCSGCTRNGACAPPDDCPDDPAKLEPGLCGCGAVDTDSDGDGAADCVDVCPLDVGDDSDADGVCNTDDACPGFDDSVDVDANGEPDGCQECVTAADCDDGNACTSDACSAAACQHAVLEGSRCSAHGFCSATAECVDRECSFSGLGSMQAGTESAAFAVSADGRWVTGYTYPYFPARTFRWSEQTGMVTLAGDTFPGRAIGNDGRIAGESGSRSFRELSFGNFVYSEQGFIATDGSADGRVLVGYRSYYPDPQQPLGVAQRWVEGSSVELLGTDGSHGAGASWPLRGDASGVSADGTWIVGGAVFPGESLSEAYLWSEATGTRRLGKLSTGAGSSSTATAISPNGQIVVGTSTRADGSREGFRWTEGSGMVSLGPDFLAQAVGDAGTVVGHLSAGGGLVQGSSLGDGNLKTLLQDCGLDMTLWTPLWLYDVSADGRTIVGTARHSSFGNKAFLAKLP